MFVVGLRGAMLKPTVSKLVFTRVRSGLYIHRCPNDWHLTRGVGWELQDWISRKFSRSPGLIKQIPSGCGGSRPESCRRPIRIMHFADRNAVEF